MGPFLSARLWAPSWAGRRGSRHAAVQMGTGRRWPLPKDLLAFWKRGGNTGSGTLRHRGGVGCSSALAGRWPGSMGRPVCRGWKQGSLLGRRGSIRHESHA